MNAVIAPLFVGVDDRLGIALRAIAMASRFERRPHVGVVVDLAVVGHPHRAVFVRQRLMAAGEIDDAEAAMHEDAVRVGVKAGAVRSAVGEHVTHPHARRDVVVTEAVGGDYPGNTAHGRSVEQAECHGIAGKRTVMCPASTCGGTLWERNGKRLLCRGLLVHNNFQPPRVARDDGWKRQCERRPTAPATGRSRRSS